MIEVEILDSPDKEVIGIYSWDFNKITLGSDQASLILIEDSGLLPLHLFLEVTEKNELYISSSKSIASFSVNGTKIKGRYCYRPEHIILAGETTFKIIKFSFKENNYQEKIEQALETIPEKRKDVEKLLTKIESKIIEMSNEKI